MRYEFSPFTIGLIVLCCIFQYWLIVSLLLVKSAKSRQKTVEEYTERQKKKSISTQNAHVKNRFYLVLISLISLAILIMLIGGFLVTIVYYLNVYPTLLHNISPRTLGILVTTIILMAVIATLMLVFVKIENREK